MELKSRILSNNKRIQLKQVEIEGEPFYMISNHDRMRPFFMSIVSDSNHWMFISSNGGLSAGRKDSDDAIFPYYTDDKITEFYDITGSKTIFWVHRNGLENLWEPFSERQSGKYSISRNLYKNLLGNKILFEEINHDLDLTFRYQWSSSNLYGFVRNSFLFNSSDSSVNIKLVDGIQNIMPYGVNTDLQAIRSNLVDAYKRSEIIQETGLGIFALSAIIVDRAEPSEALKANIAWSLGMESPTYLASSKQLHNFRHGHSIHSEEDVKAEKGAYFLSKEFQLEPHSFKKWTIVANVNQTQSSIAHISEAIKTKDNLLDLVKADIDAGSARLKKLVAASDGFQLTADKRRNARHYSNTLFNIMRGGIFDYNYQIQKWDFDKYLAKANRKTYSDCNKLLIKLPDEFTVQQLQTFALKSQDSNFTRLAIEYLPLKFSRRHGDPSRPWNKFTINTRSEEDGSKILDYEGNWRDIFQNWEALAHSFPEYIEGMIFKFLNATTFDGYNPYRVTKDGFDWEVIEDHDPWSYIGYWGDHQIIYLLKFLEITQCYYPNKLDSYFNKDLFVYANVPYKIKPYADIVRNPKDTIEFDDKLDDQIREKRKKLGADGALLEDKKHNIHKVNFIEKVLATTLAKLSNFLPEGGIWMNTQRPEWNDANNALVGNGVSMVTLYYLRRFLKFFENILEESEHLQIEISIELLNFFNEINKTFNTHKEVLLGSVSDKKRKTILDDLGNSGSDYREHIYKNNFSGQKQVLKIENLKFFVVMAIEFLEHSIRANKRTDDMYHAYNLMSFNENGVSISYLEEMLEGQVAVLSSGYLTSKETLKVLDSMKISKLFRADQYSYLLYPDKQLPRFLEKNNIKRERVEDSELLQQLLRDGNTKIIEKDIHDNFHFNSNFNNVSFLKKAMAELSTNEYGELVKKDHELIMEIYEEVFNHKAFTGRSGTFFGYEGLGSIYWHMVSKLLLAVEECSLKAIEENANQEIIGRLLEHFYEINEGIGVHKSPELYGAFPIDPYSHTPKGKGAQQPGMTGQVKEDILSRMGELGIFVINGAIEFKPYLLRQAEFLKKPKMFQYIDVNQSKKEMQLYMYELAFTYCQIPVTYSMSSDRSVVIEYKDGKTDTFVGSGLNRVVSSKVFKRTGEVISIKVNIDKALLK